MRLQIPRHGCARPRRGSTRAQPAVQPLGPRFVRRSRSSRARSAVSRLGPGKQPADQRAVVEAGAADENRQLAARGDVADRRRRFARVARRRVLLGRIGDVDQMVRNALLLGERHLVGADVEAAIHGGRVAADDFAVEAARERDAERALAGRGRADDRDERGTSERSGASRASARERTASSRTGERDEQQTAARAAASGTAGSRRARIFVEEEGDGEERLVVRVLRRQRHGRVRSRAIALSAESVKASIGEGLQRRCRSVIRPSLCTLNVTTTCPSSSSPPSGMNQLRRTCATKRRSHGPNSTPFVSNWIDGPEFLVAAALKVDEAFASARTSARSGWRRRGRPPTVPRGGCGSCDRPR